MKMIVKKVFHKLGFLPLISVLFIGCSSGIMDDLSRPKEDPTYEKPVVTSFQKENAIIISWSDDVCADEYILERSVDQAVPSYSVIYRGEETSYVDAGLLDQNRFLYRLIKIRGGKVYPPSLPAFGVSSSLTEDEFEDNDTKEKAIELLADRKANQYYYLSYDGQQIYDSDWYYVDLGPKRKAVLRLIDNDLDPGANTHFEYIVNGALNYIVNADDFEIANTEDVSRRIYFELAPNKAVYLPNINFQVGGAIISYTVKLESVTKYE